MRLFRETIAVEPAYRESSQQAEESGELEWRREATHYCLRSSVSRDS